MASASRAVEAQCAQLEKDIKNGIFAPVYLLMGEEPFYPEYICKLITDNCLQDYEKDFNETVCYGSDVKAEQVISAARRFPMMAERQLVVVKEAQLMKDVEQLSLYCEQPLDSTVLVVLMHKAAVNRTKSFYKAVKKIGVIVDSPALRDYEIASWIISYYASRGLTIAPAAAALLGESTGTELSTIAVETDKLVKNLPEGCTNVTVGDIEKNVGISRQYNIFELTRELSLHNSAKALKIAAHIGDGAKFAMPAAVSAIFNNFSRILNYGALLSRGGYPSEEDKKAALSGVNPYFYKEYDAAVRNYPVPKAMAIISMLCEYDYLGKGGDGGGTAVSDGELLTELVAKILSV